MNAFWCRCSILSKNLLGLPEVNVYHSLLVHSCSLYGRPKTLRLAIGLPDIGSKRCEAAKALVGILQQLLIPRGRPNLLSCRDRTSGSFLRGFP